MIQKFSIEVSRCPAAAPDDPHCVAIRCADSVFTRLIRAGVAEPDDYLRAPPGQLAFWLADNWWRLRFECMPAGRPPSEWRLAHDLAAIGGGYVWPSLAIWGEGSRVGLACRSDPPGVVHPIRYITDALSFITGSDYEEGVDSFLQMAADDATGFGSDRAALRDQLDALQAERGDPETAAWRRLEAELGFDPDDAPDGLMEALARLSDRFGTSSIEEAVQAYPGVDSWNVLNEQIANARHAGVPCDFSAAVDAAGKSAIDPTQTPWKQAEESAFQLRRALGIGTSPIGTAGLADLARMAPDNLGSTSMGADLKYGLRLQDQNGTPTRLIFKTRATASRRFELSRAIGDAIWARHDSLGPLAMSKTARQKFQRAFAQALLSPVDSLMSYLGTPVPEDDDITAAAAHFGVSERVIRSILVNKGVIAFGRLEDLIDAA